MLKIAICDRDRQCAEQLHELLVKLLFAKTEVEISHFADGAEVIESIKKGSFLVDLLFIDVSTERLCGGNTAAFIRKSGICVDLIFLFDGAETMPEGYSYHAFAYYQKPVKEELMGKDLHIYLEEKNEDADNLNISVKGRDIHLPLNRVVYFRSEKRKITAYTLTASVSFYGKMDEVERLVAGKGFSRCHQSYIVNCNMIDAVERREILAQGVRIPMSRKYYENRELVEENGILRLTSGGEESRREIGVLDFVEGEFKGAAVPIWPEQEILLGRDFARVDIVMGSRRISRLHCGIIYHEKSREYTVYDYSKNGILFAGGRRTHRNESIRLCAGEEISLADSENVIRLGMPDGRLWEL